MAGGLRTADLGSSVRGGDGLQRQRFAIVLASLLGAAWFLYQEHRIAVQWGYSLDDSWIYATFARNLATGHGYAFNPGHPIGGATGPLYVFILAGMYWLFRNVIWPAKILGIIALASSAVLISESMRRIAPGSRAVPLLAGILMALSPPLIWGSLSGMEIPFYLLLVCLGIYFYTNERWTLTVLCWSVGVWLRPDGLFLALLGLIARPNMTLKNTVRPTLVVITVLGGYLLFNLAAGGTWLPNSVGVKASLGGNPLAREWSIATQWLWLWGLSLRPERYGPHAVLLVPALIVGAVLGMRRWPALAIYPLGFPLVFGLFGSVGGQHGRYIAYVIPFGILLGCLGLARVAKRIPARRHPPLLLLASIAFIGWQVLAGRLVGIAHGWNVQNINRMHRFVAERVHSGMSPGDTVAVNDVGAMGYFSGCYVVDLIGLVSPKRSFQENLRLYQPKLLVIFPEWFRSFAAIDSVTNQVVFYDADSTAKYSPIVGVQLRNNTIASRNTMVVYQRLRVHEEGVRNPRLVVH